MPQSTVRKHKRRTRKVRLTPTHKASASWKRVSTPRAMWDGSHLDLARMMLDVPLKDLSEETGISASRLVTFGSGAARPTVAQYFAIRDAVFNKSDFRYLGWCA